MVRMVIEIPEEYEAVFRRFCEEQGVSPEDAVVEMMRAHLAAQKHREPASPSLPDSGARGKPRR